MSVECPICFQKFDSFRGLNGHMNRHRPKRLRAESSNMDCPICGETCSQVSNNDYECSTCETLWTKMQGDGFTYLEAEEEDILVPFFEGQVIMLDCPLCSYTTPPIQVGSGFCEDCGEMVSAFELTHYCLENHPESVRDIIEDDIDAYNEAEFWLLESHADFCPAIQSGAFTIEDIEDNL